jgi:hypothetical protein
VIATKSVKPALQLAYVKLMMDIIGRGLVMASQVDPEIKQEVAQFPANFRLSMNVFPHGPAFVARVTEQHQLELVKDSSIKPDLTITLSICIMLFWCFPFRKARLRPLPMTA